MKCKTLVAAVAALVIGGALIAAEVKSGLEVGAGIGAFDVVKVAGAPNDDVKVGTKLCYRCRYGGNPMVMVFARSADAKLASLAKSLDHEVAEHKNLKAFVNVLGENLDDAEATAKKFGEAAKLDAVPVVVPVEHENGPGDYGISPDAEVTVLIANKGKVVANIAVGKDGLNEETIKKVVESVDAVAK